MTNITCQNFKNSARTITNEQSIAKEKYNYDAYVRTEILTVLTTMVTLYQYHI